MFRVRNHTHFCTYGNKVVYFSIESDKDRCNVASSLHQLEYPNLNLKPFQEFDRFTLSHGFRKDCTVSLADTHGHYYLAETDSRFPFLVLRRNHVVSSRPISELIYLALIPEKSLQLSLYGDAFTLPESDLNVLYLDGPCLAYIYKNELCLHYIKKKTGTFGWKHGLRDERYRLAAALVTFELKLSPGNPEPTLTGRFFCLLLTPIGSARFLKASIELGKPNMSVEELVDFKQSLFFSGYLKIANVIHFHSTDVDQQVTTYICTRRSQLLQFENWRKPELNKQLKIPFPNAKHFNTFRQSNSLMGILMSESGAALVINLQTFQLLKEVATPYEFFVGHFLPAIGTQLLMVSNSEKDENKKLADRDLQIMDFKQINISKSSDETDSKDVESIDNNLYKKMIAVEGSLSAAESHLDYLNKTREEICSTLRCLSLNEETPPIQTYTFGNISQSQNLSTDQDTNLNETNANETLVHCDSPWFKIVQSHWVIGIDVINTSPHDIWELQLLGSSPDKDVSFQGKLFYINSLAPSSPVLQTPKRQKCDSDDTREIKPELANVLHPDQTAILTVALDTGIIEHNTRIKLDLGIVFKRKSKGGDVSTVSIRCLPCELTTKDLLSNTDATFYAALDEDESFHALASLNAVTDSNNVTIISGTTDLVGLIPICKQSSQFQQHAFTPILYWPHSTIQQLNGTWIEMLEIENLNRAHMCLHTKNQDQTYLLVHYLYDCFPSDIILIPYQQHSPPSLLRSIQRELNLMTALTKKMLNNSTMLETSLSNYKKFRQELNELEKETDEAFCCILNDQIDY